MSKEIGGIDWMEVGLCKKYPPEMFFPSDSVGVDRAKRVCEPCPVINECLEFALENREDHGVWGGTSERERRRILKRRRLALAIEPKGTIYNKVDATQSPQLPK